MIPTAAAVAVLQTPVEEGEVSTMVTVTGTGCVLVAGLATGIVTPPMVTAWVSSRGVVWLMFSVSISFVAIAVGRWFKYGLEGP